MSQQRVARAALRFAAVALIFGGSVRILATRSVFSAFGIGELFPARPYSLYIYRVLGSFVVLVGMVLWLVSRDPRRYHRVVKGLVFGFLLLAAVMTFTGLLLRLRMEHFLVDSAFSVLLALLFLWVANRD